MAANKTVLERIKDFTGDDITDVASYEDLITSGFNYMIDALPVDSQFWQSNNATAMSTSSTLTSMDTRKVINVTATYSDSIERVAKEISLADYRKGLDTTSIYYHGASVKNPVYSISETGGMLIAPTADSVKIFYVEYLDSADNIVDANLGTEFAAFNFPKEIVFAAILRSSINLLNARVSIASQDEEDTELLSILTGQLAVVKELFADEMQRLNIPTTFVGDRNDVK